MRDPVSKKYTWLTYNQVKYTSKGSQLETYPVAVLLKLTLKSVKYICVINWLASVSFLQNAMSHHLYRGGGGVGLASYVIESCAKLKHEQLVE